MLVDPEILLLEAMILCDKAGFVLTSKDSHTHDPLRWTGSVDRGIISGNFWVTTMGKQAVLDARAAEVLENLSSSDFELLSAVALFDERGVEADLEGDEIESLVARGLLEWGWGGGCQLTDLGKEVLGLA